MSTPFTGYHEDYGLPEQVRMDILKTAEELGALKASEIHRIHVNTIYKWRRAIKAHAAT